MRIPLLAAGPGVPRARTRGQMVLNIDLAPTILEMAGVPIPSSVQGRSFEPLFDDRPAVQWRESFPYEYFLEDWLPGVPTMVGVRTTEWKYVTYPEIDELDELYDLRRDPLEMTNLATNPHAQPQLARMKGELKRLASKTGR